MPNRQGRHAPAPRQFDPRGALGEGNTQVSRLTRTAGGEALAAEADAARRVGSAQARAMETVGRALAAFAAPIGRWADKAAEAEGRRAGAIAGLDPEFRPRRAGTIRADAFDQAGIQTYADQLDLQLREDAARITDAHRASPKGVAAAFDALDREYRTSHVFQEVMPAYQATLGRLRLSAVRQATRAVAAEANAARKAAFETDLDQRLRDLGRNAYFLGLDGAADEAIAGEMTGLASQLEARGADGARLRSEAEAARIMRRAELAVATARVQGAFERTEGIEARQTFLEEFEAAYREGEGPMAVFDVEDFLRRKAAMERGIEADVRDRRRPAAALRSAMRDVEAGLDEGLLPAAGVVAALDGAVGRALDGDLAADFERMRARTDFVAAARQARPEELGHIADRRRAELGETGVTDPAQIEDIDLVDRLKSNAEAALARDPLGWAERVGLVDVPDVDPASPDFAGQFQSRAVVAEEVAAHYGREPVYLRPIERSALAAAMAGADSETKLALLGGVAGAAGRRAAAVFAEIGEDAPAVAHVGGLVAIGGRDLAVARDALSGLTAEGEGVAAAMPQGQVGEVFGETVGGALVGLEPAGQRAIMETARAAYSARALRAGIAEFDGDLYREVLDETLGARPSSRRLASGQIRTEKVGGLGSWRGRPVVLPVSLSQSRFEATLGGIEDRDLGPLSASGGKPEHIDGTAAGAAELRDGWLVHAGGESYFVSMSDPAVTPQYLIDGETGADYRIRLDAAAAGRVEARRRAAPATRRRGERNRVTPGGAILP